MSSTPPLPSDFTSSWFPVTFKIALFFGAYKLLRFTWTVVANVYQYMLCKLVPNNLYSRYGTISNSSDASTKSWAMVTGASDGIGLAMCKALAGEHGFNILMVSRSREKLEKAKEEVLTYSKNKVKVAIEVQDFSQITTLEEYTERFE